MRPERTNATARARNSSEYGLGMINSLQSDAINTNQEATKPSGRSGDKPTFRSPDRPPPPGRTRSYGQNSLSSTHNNPAVAHHQ